MKPKDTKEQRHKETPQVRNFMQRFFVPLCLCVFVFLLNGPAFAADDLRLVDAVKNRDRVLVRSLIEQHLNVNAAQPDGTTALAWAATRDDSETADLLIRAGANV